MMCRIGIIADDLTGAGDTAVQFVRAGWDTELQLRPCATRASVIAVTTDSRGQNAHDAAEAVTATVTRLRKTGVTHLYKKIDSTLRGQVRSEVHATVDSWTPHAIAIACPAFPAMGRIVIDGALRVNGMPVTEGHIPTLLGASHIAGQADESPRNFAERIKHSGRIVVVDATSEDDLRRLADAVALLGPDAIPVGSAGLARHLARAWRSERANAPAVVIVTSLQDTARRQAAALEAAGAFRYEPTPDDLVDDAAWMRSSAAMLEQLDESNATILLIAPDDLSHGLPATLIPTRFADLAGRIFAHRAHRPGGSISGIVVTGGDGARALVDAFEATGIKLRDEVTTGVPIGTLVGGLADGLPVVTKAGGFGTEDTLVQAVEAVHAARDRRVA